MRDNRTLVILVSVIIAGLLIGALVLGRHALFKRSLQEKPVSTEGPLEEYTYLKVFFPVGGKLQIFEKRIKGTLSQTKLAETLMEEFLSLNEEMNTGVLPSKIKLLNAYISNEGVLYLNFPSAFARGFRGDALDEYLLLKGILDTMISNLTINDVVILVGGREIESLGGHFFLNRPLKRTLSVTFP